MPPGLPRLRSAPRPRRALTAAAGTITTARVPDGPDQPQQSSDWQARAIDYYDRVGPVKYSAQFYARALAKLRIFPAIKNEAGEFEPTDNAVAVEATERLQDPGGGRSRMFAAYGRLSFLIGESLLLGTFDDTLETGERWEIVSKFELTKSGEDYVRKRGPNETGERLRKLPVGATEIASGQCIVYRLWRRHPIYSGQADAPMRGVIDDCEELVLLTEGVFSRIRSRIANGKILLIADEVSMPAPEPGTDEDPHADPVMSDIIRAITTAIQNPGSAAGVAPIMARVQSDLIEKAMKVVPIFEPGEKYEEQGMRAEAIHRFGIGIDAPPEMVEGLTGANHWTSWQIDDDKWTHIEPVARELVDDLTAVWLRPVLREAGVPDWQRYSYDFDPADVITNPDKGKDAQQLHDRLAISDKALRDATDFQDDDKPDDAELRRRMAIKMRAPQLLEGPASGQEAGDGDDPSAVEPSSPDEMPEEPPAIAAAANAWILGAAELALERARELAGSRLRTRARNGCRECAQQVAPLSNALVAAALGRDTVTDLGAPDPLALVAGGADSLIATMTRAGHGAIAEPLAQLVEQHAAATLFEPEPAPLPAAVLELASEEPVAA